MRIIVDAFGGDNAPKEIRLIANDFNRMMGELSDMMNEVCVANDRQRQAELPEDAAVFQV